VVCPLRIGKLEAVQGRATRWITRADDDYDTRRSKLKLLSLSDRRFIRDVTFLFNVINGHYDLNISNKLIFCEDRARVIIWGKRTHRTLFQILAELTVLNIILLNRIVDEWNSFPNYIRQLNSIGTF